MRRYKALPTNLPKEEVDPIPLTADFLEAAQQEFNKLNKEQKEVQQRVKDAREMGDLSENGAYKYGKFELGRIRRRLGELGFLLKHGFKVEITDAGDTIVFGSTVTVEQQGKAEKKFQLLTKYEANPNEGKISVESPLGKALLGKKVGQIAELKLPKMTHKFVILEIN